MAATGPSRDGVLADINVTPLVDVMLVLLVIFMVTAPLITQGVEVDLPQAEAAALPSDEDKLVLTLDAKGRAYLGEVEVAIADLPDKLRHNAKVQRDKELFLHADRSLPYGDVVRVMGMAKSAGVTSLGMVTDPLTTEAR